MTAIRRLDAVLKVTKDAVFSMKENVERVAPEETAVSKGTQLPYPRPTSPTATKKMRSNRRSDTKPEVSLRSLLHRGGLRFRKDYPIQVPSGKGVHADIAFTRLKVAVFVDGCFWHSCPEHGTIPKSNQEYWIPKLKQNVERDRVADRKLQAAGWRVLRFWEHVDPEAATMAVQSALDQSETQFAPSASDFHDPQCPGSRIIVGIKIHAVPGGKDGNGRQS